jgi:hypothetical protein
LDQTPTFSTGGYAKFLQYKNLALDKHQPYLVRWVREFLLFARAHAGYSFEQTLDLFLAEAGGCVGTKPWQLQQASDAIRIYRYQYHRGAKAEDGDSPTAQALVDDAARTTMIYTHVVRELKTKARSPLDDLWSRLMQAKTAVADGR